MNFTAPPETPSSAVGGVVAAFVGAERGLSCVCGRRLYADGVAAAKTNRAKQSVPRHAGPAEERRTSSAWSSSKSARNGKLGGMVSSSGGAQGGVGLSPTAVGEDNISATAEQRTRDSS